MSVDIEYCENSTITEAWAVIIGSAGEIRDSDVGALENIASKKLGEFKPIPSFVFVENNNDNKIVPPFWHKQLSYNDGKYITRLGHHYLSVHYKKIGQDKYDKYENSLLPQIDTWLDSYSEMVSGKQDTNVIKKVGFGYLNTFKLPMKDFDLSQYFKINFGTNAESAKNGLGALEVKFKLNYLENNSDVEVNISVFPESPESDQIAITTKVIAYKAIEKDYSFEEKDNILDIVMDAKNAARAVFFDLATTETHKIMGAKYASGTTQ